MARGRTTTDITTPGFIADPNSIVRGPGIQPDWTYIADTYKNADGKKALPAGTVMARIASSNKGVPRAQSTTITVVVASNVATATATTHGFAVGEIVQVSGASADYVNGTMTILAVPNANTFTFTATGANVTPTGTIVANRQGVGLLATNALEDSATAAMTGYGTIIGGSVFQTLLPEASGSPKVLAAIVKTELQAAGTGFAWQTYADSRAY